MPDLEEWCSKNNIFWAQPGLVDNPPELSPHNLPYQLHELVPEKYKKYLQSKATHDPLNFIEQLDKFWKTDITKVMPEWKKVFDNLHWKENDRLERLNEVAKVMSISEKYEQMKWIIARNELNSRYRRGSLSYQKPKSSSTFDMHERVNGLHLGLRSVILPDIVEWLSNMDVNLYDINHRDEKIKTSQT